MDELNPNIDPATGLPVVEETDAVEEMGEEETEATDAE